MTDRELLSELQYVLIEPPDGGDTFPSLIWTRGEVLDAINAGVRALIRDTHLVVTRVEIPVAAGATSIPLPADWLATAHLVWRAQDQAPLARARGGGAPTWGDRTVGEFPLTGLVSYWKLDEASGTRADAHGSNPLTDHNGVSTGAGKIAGAAQFISASTQTLSYPDVTAPLGDEDFTYTLWSKRAVVSTLMGALVKATGTYEIILSDDGRIFFAINAFAIQAYTPQIFNDLAWHFLVAWHDAANNRINLQIDNGPIYSADTGGFVPAAAGLVSIGLAYYGGAYYFDGLIDEVGLWRRILTPAERTQLYNAGAGLAYPVAPTTTGVRTPLGPVDAFEGDLADPGWEVLAGLPLGYADLDGPTLTLRLVPTPDVPGVIELLYIANVPLVAPVIAGAATPLPLAPEFSSALKYAALGTLLRKVGRLLDDERARYAERRYQLTQTAASILLGGWA